VKSGRYKREYLATVDKSIECYKSNENRRVAIGKARILPVPKKIDHKRRKEPGDSVVREGGRIENGGKELSLRQ